MNENATINLTDLRERPSRYDVDAEAHESVPVSVEELNALLDAVDALALLPAAHSWPDGKFCSDDCAACAKHVALAYFAAVPVSGDGPEEQEIGSRKRSVVKPDSVEDAS